MNNIWQNLPRPFFVLAPMDDVTDVTFRQLVEEIAPPDLFMTEFVSTDGLQSPGRTNTLERLRLWRAGATPTIAQIWGNDPELYLKSARDIAELGGFAGIDINLGCPEKGIVARGCCGGLIGNANRVAELIAAVKEGAPNLPVSVKTRLGINQIITEDWIGFLLTQDLAAITLHGRTVREMSKVPAHWDEIAKAVKLRDETGAATIMIGNGDVLSQVQGVKLAKETGIDGIMIGRGIFHDPFIFDPSSSTDMPAERIDILLRHLALYEHWGRTKPFQTLKKFFKIYIHSWPGAAELRAKLMDAATPEDVRAILKEYIPPAILEPEA